MNVLVALVFLVQQQPIPERPEGIQYKAMDFQVPNAEAMRETLSNGAVVYVLEDRSLPKVDLAIYTRAGSFWEPKGKEGLAALTGVLMRTGGTKSRAPEQLDEELDFLAAELAVAIGDTQATASLSVLSKDLDKGLEILFDVLKNPAFAQEKFDLLRAQTMERLKSRNDSTSAIESRESNLLLYGSDFPLNAHPTGASIQSITREDLQRMHAQSFHPSKFVIAVAGDFSRRELIRKLERAMGGDWPTRPVAAQVPELRHEAAPGLYAFHKDGANINQGRVTMGHVGIDIFHPDAFALRILNYIYGGGGFSSRITQKVRTESGLAYSVHSSFRPGILYPGTMAISFQSKSESCALAAKMCLEELEVIREELVTELELAAAQQFYIDAFPGLFFSTPSQTVQTFAQAELNRYPKDYYGTYRQKIKDVTREDVRRAARELLHPEKLVIVVVGNVPALKAGNAQAKLADLGREIRDVPLPDPVTLQRPKP